MWGVKEINTPECWGQGIHSFFLIFNQGVQIVVSPTYA
jgi:hypothetical protein